MRLSDVAITGDVDHVLARAALAIKRRAIVDALNDVSLDLEPVLRDLKARLNASLSGYGFAPNAALHGQVETMHVDDILVAEELIVVASAFGELLEPLPSELRERFERTALEVLAALAPHEAVGD